uniref:GOLD domain-containing protein n=1 Tax=Megaselia scalaris TaxID=36166 RepID=T1GT25_MEGSC
MFQNWRFLIAFVIGIHISSCREITTNIEPGSRDCFYQAGKAGDTIDIEYQVIDGGHGDFDISFDLIEPTGRLLYSDFNRPWNQHTQDIRIDGVYKLCFDNTFSVLNTKIVHFDLFNETFDSKTNYSEYLYASINYIQRTLSSHKRYFNFYKYRKTRQSHFEEKYNLQVQVWFFIKIINIILVGFFQVFMIKRIIENGKIQEIQETILKK